VLIVLALFHQLALADSLHANGHYETARIEYMRAFFFHPELRQELGPRLRYALSLFNIDETKGISELNSIVDDFPELPDSVKAEIAHLYVQVNRHYLAINLLRDTDEKELLGLIYLLDDQLSNARNTFIETGDYEVAGQIDDFIKGPQKSGKTAILLSLFLPGLGQVYAGNVRQGAMDFSLNLGSAYLFYNALRQHKYVDAGLVFFFLLNRFYLGSLHNAHASVLEYNEKQHQKWLKIMLKKYFSNTKVD
jgi:hypothetical protein